MIDNHVAKIEKVLGENHPASSVWQLGDAVLSIIEEQQKRIEKLESTVEKQEENIRYLFAQLLGTNINAVHDLMSTEKSDV